MSDTDRDGLRAWEEYVADTDPTNASSRLRISDMSGSRTNAIGFHSSTNRTYDLYWNSNILVSQWFGVNNQTNQTGNGSILWLTDTNSASHRYYRILVR